TDSAGRKQFTCAIKNAPCGKSFQRLAKCTGRLESLVRRLRQAPAHDRFQCGRHTETTRILVNYRADCSGRATAAKHRSAAEPFIKYGAKREDIGACVGRLSLRLFG